MKYGKLLLILAIALGGGAMHAARAGGMEHHADAVGTHEGYGIVKSVNTAEGKVKIAHEPIPSMGWPAMTMWFKLSVPLTPGIGEGDGVRFELQQENGKWVIGRIERGK